MRLLRPKEAAKKLGVDVKTLKLMEGRGEIETVRLPNGHRRYRSTDISKMMGEDHDILNDGGIK